MELEFKNNAYTNPYDYYENKDKYIPSIDDSLKTIAKNLLRLKYLTLKSGGFDFPNQDPIKGYLFPILAQFKTIKCLRIFGSSFNLSDKFGPIQSLKSRKDLKYLEIIETKRSMNIRINFRF